MDIEKLTLREKIGQTVIALCTKEKFDKLCGSSEEFIKKYPIGGLFPCRELVNGKMEIVQTNEFNAIMEEYNRYSRVPLIAATDGPNDNADMISFGGAMLLGATGNKELAYEYGNIMGRKISSCNLHWWFEPVVDLNISPKSPVTNVRAISDDADFTVSMAREIIKGIQDNGVAATAKHFPGPSDVESIDAHLAPVSNTISEETWYRTNGKVYRMLFENDDVMSVMTAHQNLLFRQKEKIDGKYPPATMSKELVTNLLKGELGFKGVVVTDALVMGGFAGVSGMKNQVRSFAAGNDVVLWPDIEYIDLVEEEILNGNIPIERLNDAVRRILDMKERLGIIDGSFKPKSYDAAEAKDIAKKIADKGVTLIQNGTGVIPAKNLSKVLIVAVTPDDGSYESMLPLKECFEKYGISADIQRDIWQDELKEKQNTYDLVIFALCRQIHKPIGPLEFWGENASSIWASNSADPNKIIVVSFGNPYSYEYYRETETSYVNAYTATPETIDAFVRGITGRMEFTGTSPVKLR